MSLEQTVNEGIKKAMLSRNEPDLRALRAIKAAILTARTAEGGSRELGPSDEEKLLRKLVRQRRDSLEIFTAQHREDLASREAEEIAIIEKFLPAPVSGAELEKAIREIIAETGASSPSDIGKVTGLAVKKLGGSADGKTISATVRELLSK
ncbi:MAG TPA: GatB/YqeY domain-containing protein [Chitinophagaceae bacterium]|nr:GatB/YqeY domain-containing protein [Chitinophagaceae bacterium]